MRETDSFASADISSRRAFWLVFLIALVIRIAYLFSSPDRDWPHATHYEGDAPLWVSYARAIQSGESFELGLPIHAPGMGYLLMILGAAKVQSFVWLKLLFGILGSLNCALVVRVASRMVGASLAVVAGLLSAASFGLLVQSTSLNNETPYTGLLLATIALTLRLAGRPHLSLCVLLGIVHAVAALFRPEHLLLALLATAYLLAKWIRRTLGAGPFLSPTAVVGRLAVIGGSCLGLLLPWGIRNHNAIHRFNQIEATPVRLEAAPVTWEPEAADMLRALPAFARDGNFRYINHLAAEQRLTTISPRFVEWFFNNQMGYWPRPLNPWCLLTLQGPLSFALANNDLAEGGFSTRLLDPSAAVAVAFGNPRHLRLMQDGYHVGWRFIRDNPRAAMALVGRKLWIFAQGLASGFTAWNFPLGLDGLRRPVDQWTANPNSPGTIVWTCLILMLAGFGALRCRAAAGIGLLLLVVLYKALVTIAFYGYARQGVSILPIWYVLVAAGLCGVVSVARPHLTGKRPTASASRPRTGRGPSLALIVACAALGISAAINIAESRRYDVEGPIDSALQWGATAFESHQSLRIRRL